MSPLAAPLARDRLFAGLLCACLINGAAHLIDESIGSLGWLNSALNLFGVSAILWLAGAAMIDLLWRCDPPSAQGVRRLDVPVAAAAMLCMLVPIPALSAGAGSGLAVYLLLTAKPGSGSHRGALIALAITASLLWGRLILGLGANTLLAADAAVVNLVSGGGGTRNLIGFATAEGGFTVAPGCSSLHNISLALVLWTTVTQAFTIPLSRRSIMVLIAATLGAIAMNVIRLAAMAHYPQHFDLLHTGTGAVAFGWLALIAICLPVYFGLRHARPRHA